MNDFLNKRGSLVALVLHLYLFAIYVLQPYKPYCKIQNQLIAAERGVSLTLFDCVCVIYGLIPVLLLSLSE